MTVILSPHNEFYRKALSLAHRIGPGKQAEECLIEGEKLIREALRSGASVHSLFLSSETEESFGELKEQVIRKKGRAFSLPPNLLQKLSALESPSHSAAIISLPEFPKLPDILSHSRTLVILDRVQDPGNVGTIIRTSEALKADALLLLKGSCSRRNTKVLRAAMGASFRFPVYEGLEPEPLLSMLHRFEFTTIAADAQGKTLSNAALPPKSAFFFGAEGKGLAPFLRKNCRETLAIPMNPVSESLNVATTVALFLFEAARNKTPRQ